MDYSKYYALWHDMSDQNYVSHMKTWFWDQLSEHIPADKNINILEIGSSNGLCIRTLKDKGYNNVLGLEPDIELNKVAEEHGIHLINKDALSFLGNSDDKFDFIFMIDVLEHIEKPQIIELLKMINKRLNEDGKLLLVVPNANSVVATNVRYVDFTHTLSFTATSMYYCMTNSGFHHIQIEEQEHRGQDADKELQLLRGLNKWIYKKEIGDAPFVKLASPNIKVIATKQSLEEPQLLIKAKDNMFNLYNFISEAEKNIKEVAQINQALENFSEKNIKEVAQINQALGGVSEALKSNYLSIESHRDILIELDKKQKSLLIEMYKGIFYLNNKNLLNKIVKKLYNANQIKVILQSGMFDENFYRQTYGIEFKSKKLYIKHFLNHGSYYGYKPNYDFDVFQYVINNPSLITSNINPFVHYILNRGED